MALYVSHTVAYSFLYAILPTTNFMLLLSKRFALKRIVNEFLSKTYLSLEKEQWIFIWKWLENDKKVTTEALKMLKSSCYEQEICYIGMLYTNFSF